MRFNELKGLDVTFVVVEADYTFTGKPKDSLLFSKRMSELERTTDAFTEKYSLSKVMGISKDPWVNEANLRNCIKKTIENTNPKADDVVIISDADEIHRRSVIEAYRPADGFKALITDKYGYYINLLEGRQSWNRSRIMPWSYLENTTPEEVRNSGYPNQIDNAGWHFSWLGGVDKMLEKFAAFSHQEKDVQKRADRKLLEYKTQTGQSLWGDDFWEVVQVDETYPIDVVNNMTKYIHLIFLNPATNENT